MEKTSRFSQNFLRDPRLVKSLLSKTDINKNDIVYDIGGGKGIIASALAEKCHTVISVEKDPELAHKLHQNLQHQNNVLVFEADFLSVPLPQTPYKVFANIPFNLSADILRKLTSRPKPPTTSYLIVQKEFADKLISKSARYNSQLSILLGVQFKVRIVQLLKPADFYPRPNVESVLIEIAPRLKSLVAAEDTSLFRDFIVYAYNACLPNIAVAFSSIFTSSEFSYLAAKQEFSVNAKPSQLGLLQWCMLFERAVQKRTLLESLVGGYEFIVEQRHSKRTKVHRTRPDRR